jgi:hypothetical protein
MRTGIFPARYRSIPRPTFSEEYGTHRYDVKLNLLRLAVTYARVRPGRSLVIRAGQLSSAFGSFLSRYDDGVNPLIDVPLAYGYYERGVTYLGLAGISVEAAAGKLDARAQFVNSSPANRRSLFDREQYGNWAGGLGYTITQGFRIGISAYRGPYLDRHHEHYSPGEADPHQLPGSAYGIEAQWARGHWSAYGELQKFLFTYRAIQDYNTHLGYAELRRVLRPRWYLAGRASYRRASAGPALEIYEAVVGFRLSRHQLIKTGYEIQQRAGTNGDTAGVFAVQLVTTLPSISVAGR